MKAVGTPELIRDMRRGRSPSVQRFRAPFRAGAQMEPMRGCRSSTVTLSPPKPPRALRVPNPADPGINRTIRAPESAQDRRARPDPLLGVPHDLRSPWDRSGALVLESEGASTMREGSSPRSRNDHVKDQTGHIKTACNVVGSISAYHFKVQLAKCITPDMDVYRELEVCIFCGD